MKSLSKIQSCVAAFILFSLAISGLQTASAQESKAKATSGDAAFEKVEKMPAYPGGHDALVKFMIENIKYPEAAKKAKVQGTVFVSFIVKADGTVTDTKVLRGIGSGCDEEALRVVGLMPKWTPGENKGKKVDVAFNLPVKFALDAGKEKPAEPAPK